MNNDTDRLTDAAERIGTRAILTQGKLKCTVEVLLPRIVFGRLEFLVSTPEGGKLWVREASLETPDKTGKTE